MYLTPQDYEIAEKNGINYVNARQRFYRYGWTTERTINKPIRKSQNLWQQWKEIAEANGIKRNTFYNRIYTLGMTPKRAATKPIPPPLIAEETFKRAAENGINKNILRQRLRNGCWEEERAVTEPPGERGKYKRK